MAGLLFELVEEWPVPVTEVVLIGHSMGGALCTRPAGAVTWLVCLGSPHTGTPLERGVARAAALFGRFAALGWLRASGQPHPA